MWKGRKFKIHNYKCCIFAYVNKMLYSILSLSFRGIGGVNDR